jgi:hypothetical protein
MMLAMLLILSSFVDQGGSSVTQANLTQVNEAALRAAASVYPVPEYPQESIHALHSGRVAIEVVVAPPSSTSALATVRSSKVLETPDSYNDPSTTFADIQRVLMLTEERIAERISRR